MCEKIVAGGINGLSINKDFDKKKSKNPKFSHQKWVECEMRKKNQNIICPQFLENRISTTI